MSLFDSLARALRPSDAPTEVPPSTPRFEVDYMEYEVTSDGIYCAVSMADHMTGKPRIDRLLVPHSVFQDWLKDRSAFTIDIHDPEPSRCSTHLIGYVEYLENHLKFADVRDYLRDSHPTAKLWRW